MNNEKTTDFLIVKYIGDKELNINIIGRKPIGFSFCKNNHVITDSWINIYLKFLKYLYEFNSTLFLDLPFNKNVISSSGRLYFATREEYVRKAKGISKHFFIETNLSANLIINNISMLADIFNIDKSEILFYIKKNKILY